MKVVGLLCLGWAGPGWAAPTDSQITVGSYGRMGVSTNGEGGRGEPRQVVSAGPRLLEQDYLELDLGYRDQLKDGTRTAVHTTLALTGDLFHYTAKPTTGLLLRQAFVEADKVMGSRAFVWLGGRWLRGDDIYLLDLWPMDDLNLVGAGAGARWSTFEISGALGFNRLENGRQIDRVPVPAPSTRGAQTVVLHDRQRLISTVKAQFLHPATHLAWKAVFYSEFHFLPKGRRTLPGTFDETEPLADDLGFMLGAQFGLWNFGRNGHLNLWARYAQGLAAYDELATPTGLNDDRRSVDAKAIQVAVAGNYETSLGKNNLGVQYGGYTKFFYDADDETEDFDDTQEVSFSVRPQLMMGQFTPAVEASVQLRRANGLNPRTNTQDVARVVQFAAIPALTLANEPGVYSRPQLRLIYALSLLNQGALDLYAVDDPRSEQATVHYLGARAEWWFGRGGSY